MPDALVSILVPLYNEEEFVDETLRRVLSANLPPGMRREVVVVDDGSTDESASIVEGFAALHPDQVRLVRKAKNAGKGAAIRTALEYASGEYTIIQDGDLEYHPREYAQLLQPLIDGVADVVYGSRFANASRRRVLYFWHTVANYGLTVLCNIVSDLNLTDMETGYKAFRTSLLKSVPIRCNRFGIEPELTIKLAKRQARFYEVPIAYEGRTYEEGKKVGLWDALEAVAVICRTGLTADLYQDHGAEILDAFSVAPRFNRWMADTIRPFVGRKVLEIGCGIGNLTRQFASRRERYVASDIDTEHLFRLQSRLHHNTRLEVRRCDLSVEADFEPFRESMDTVICLNVLEHMEHDVACLRNIYSTLEAGGRAVVLVPCGPALYGQLDVVLGHYRRYTEGELRRVTEEAGFHCERIVEFNRASTPGWFVASRLLRRSRIARLQIRIFDRLVWLWRRIDRFFPWPPTSLIVVAVKPSGSVQPASMGAPEQAAVVGN